MIRKMMSQGITITEENIDEEKKELEEMQEDSGESEFEDDDNQAEE